MGTKALITGTPRAPPDYGFRKPAIRDRQLPSDVTGANGPLRD